MRNDRVERCVHSESATPGAEAGQVEQEKAMPSVAGSPVALVQGTALQTALGRALPVVQGAAVPQSSSPKAAKGCSLIDEFYSADHAIVTAQRERS
jgi:hypothetical protein